MLVRGIRRSWLRIRRGLVELGNPRLGNSGYGKAVSTSLYDVQPGGFEDLAGENAERLRIV